MLSSRWNRRTSSWGLSQSRSRTLGSIDSLHLHYPGSNQWGASEVRNTRRNLPRPTLFQLRMEGSDTLKWLLGLGRDLSSLQTFIPWKWTNERQRTSLETSRRTLSFPLCTSTAPTTPLEASKNGPRTDRRTRIPAFSQLRKQWRRDTLSTYKTWRKHQCLKRRNLQHRSPRRRSITISEAGNSWMSPRVFCSTVSG